MHTGWETAGQYLKFEFPIQCLTQRDSGVERTQRQPTQFHSSKSNDSKGFAANVSRCKALKISIPLYQATWVGIWKTLLRISPWRKHGMEVSIPTFTCVCCPMDSYLHTKPDTRTHTLIELRCPSYSGVWGSH